MYLAGDVVFVLRHPFQALPLLDNRRRLRDGLVALALGVVLPALVQEFAALAPYRRLTAPTTSPEAAVLTNLFNRWSYQERFRLPIYGVVAGLLLWLLAAALVHAVARALHGRGTFTAYLKLVGYVAFAGIVTLPLSALDAALKATGNPAAEGQLGSLLLLLSVGVFAWQNVLLILAAQAHYGLSMERASTAVLGPVGALVVLLIVVVVVATVLALVGGRALVG